MFVISEHSPFTSTNCSFESTPSIYGSHHERIHILHWHSEDGEKYQQQLGASKAGTLGVICRMSFGSIHFSHRSITFRIPIHAPHAGDTTLLFALFNERVLSLSTGLWP